MQAGENGLMDGLGFAHIRIVKIYTLINVDQPYRI
jgi:hypothetical protein